ncbi:MAG TPA: APC family permease, partial [Pyrinomonadaceae bacterium]
MSRTLSSGERYAAGARNDLLSPIKRLLIGRALKTEQAAHERLTKKTALAVFSSDALSSTAYATEEILLVLAVAAAATNRQSFYYVVPVSVGIAMLLAIVAISYRQTIHAYPSGGGAYIVAKENLGQTPGLVAAAALLVDYVLTVSVSIAAGVAAITSAAQGTRFAGLIDHKVILCLIFILFIALANLRGVRESGALFATPTYLFVVSFIFMIVYGLFHYWIYGGAPPVPSAEHLKTAEGYHLQPLTTLLLLGAFSNGCTALTGIEAISNGVPAFKKPEAQNAATTLVWMAVLLTTMFLGTSVMAYLFQVHPHENETVISQFARIMFSGRLGWFYYVVQASTAAILVLAANTSFADFPRLSSLLARDRFLPRQFANRGDKLVFSNGIIILAVFSGILVVAFGGDTSRLIPLYAVGVFLSFTLSQLGMVRRWYRTKSARWKKSIVINAIGAMATFIVLCVFIATKFIHGAWIVVVVIPLLVLLFREIHEHYVDVAKQLSMNGLSELRPIRHSVVVPISGLHRGVITALEYAKSISRDNHVTAVYVDFEEEATAKLREKWERWGAGIKLVVLPSPYRELTRPLLKYIKRLEQQERDDVITVVLPEFIPAKWWQHILHNQSSLLL